MTGDDEEKNADENEEDDDEDDDPEEIEIPEDPGSGKGKDCEEIPDIAEIDDDIDDGDEDDEGDNDDGEALMVLGNGNDDKEIDDEGEDEEKEEKKEEDEIGDIDAMDDINDDEDGDDDDSDEDSNIDDIDDIDDDGPMHCVWLVTVPQPSTITITCWPVTTETGNIDEPLIVTPVEHPHVSTTDGVNAWLAAAKTFPFASMLKAFGTLDIKLTQMEHGELLLLGTLDAGAGFSATTQLNQVLETAMIDENVCTPGGGEEFSWTVAVAVF